MINIISGTTPTITYTFKLVSPSDFTAVYLTIKRGGNIIITKQLEDAVIGESTVSWTLTQEETLLLGASTCKMMCNWLTQNGVRGASIEVDVKGVYNHIPEVINGTG